MFKNTTKPTVEYIIFLKHPFSAKNSSLKPKKSSCFGFSDEIGIFHFNKKYINIIIELINNIITTTGTPPDITMMFKSTTIVIAVYITLVF
jgi:hypothetical protein